MTTQGHRFVFVGGLPRSGTSATYQVIGSHPAVSRLCNTGYQEDEGQGRQSVYLTEDQMGGPGRFGLHPAAHMTETSPQLAGAGQKLFESWSRYWDLSKPVLCEKSPGNLVRSRFLQAAFPDSSFVFVVRHPAAYALAVLKWDHRAPLSIMIRNWLACQRRLMDDLPHLKRAIVIRYRDLTADAEGSTRKMEAFLDLEPGMDSSLIKRGMNTRYFQSWKAGDYRTGPHPARNAVKRLWTAAETRYIERRYERAINDFGFSFSELYRR